MHDFVITERTEPFTLNEVFEFIDDTSIGKLDACELKSRIVDVVDTERNKAIDDFIRECDKHCGFYGGYNKNITREDILKIAKQLKAGGENEQRLCNSMQ